jgi:hypothetical protein
VPNDFDWAATEGRPYKLGHPFSLLFNQQRTVTIFPRGFLRNVLCTIDQF